MREINSAIELGKNPAFYSAGDEGLGENTMVNRAAFLRVVYRMKHPEAGRGMKAAVKVFFTCQSQTRTGSAIEGGRFAVGGGVGCDQQGDGGMVSELANAALGAGAGKAQAERTGAAEAPFQKEI